jgi:8-oxo-dGTP pyrophosphatase MutT (NUDIX family)
MGKSVASIIFSKDRKSALLIQRRDIPVWVLPGGGIDAGESPEEAALRETKEETGFSAEIVRKIAEYSPYNRLSRYTYFFEVTPTAGEPTLGAETGDIQFFPIDKLPSLLPPNYPYWIQDAAAELPFVLYKKVEGTSYWMLLKLLLRHPDFCRALPFKINKSKEGQRRRQRGKMILQFQELQNTFQSQQVA